MNPVENGAKNTGNHYYAPAINSVSQYFIPNEEDVDSDVLSDSEEEKDEDETNQIDDQINAAFNDVDTSGQMELDDDEVYQLFVQSVRDEHVAESIIAKGDDDDDDDDDFNPDPSDDSVSDYDDEDYDDDMTEETDEAHEAREASKVQTREIRDLLNECWLEIAGNKPNVPVNYPPTYLNDPSIQRFPGSSIGNTSNENTLLTSDQFSMPSRFPSNENQSNQPNAPGTTTTSTTNNLPAMNAQNKTLLTSLVSQLFTSGQNISENYIDNLPVFVIRRLVAKQMSMALQLLIQLLLQADDHSECFDKCYQQLLVLSNLRNAAVKKAKLFQMNLELLKNISSSVDTNRLKLLKDNEFHQILMEVVPQIQQQKQQLSQNQQQPSSSSSASLAGNMSIPPSLKNSMNDLNNHNNQSNDSRLESNHSNTNNTSNNTTNNNNNNNNNNPSNSSNTGERRIMTRSCLINYNKQSHRSSSLFDIPILSTIHDFMTKIDEKKRLMLTDSLPFSNHLTIQNRHHPSSVALVSPYFQHFEQQLKIYKFQLNEFYLKQLYSDCPQLKFWNCLIPKSNYPFLNYFQLLNQGAANNNNNNHHPQNNNNNNNPNNSSSSSISMKNKSFLNPLTIEGRKFFTPAEDDLLLKGIVEYGDENLECWELIHKKYLTFKKTELLQFHYHEKTLCSNLLQNNDFKRYQQLIERDRKQIQANGSNAAGNNNQNNIFLKNSNPLALTPPQMNGIGFISPNHSNPNHNNSGKKREERWTSIEDLYLLKGFQVFGEKFPLISIYFLNHRSVHELRNRWSFLQNVWNKAFNLQRRNFLMKNPQMTIIYDNIPIMSNEVKSFLFEINHSFDFNSLQNVWLKGFNQKLPAGSSSVNLSTNSNQQQLMTQQQTQSQSTHQQSQQQFPLHSSSTYSISSQYDPSQPYSSQQPNHNNSSNSTQSNSVNFQFQSFYPPNQPQQQSQPPRYPNNQINFTSIMDDVSCFEQDILPDSSDEEEDVSILTDNTSHRKFQKNPPKNQQSMNSARGGNPHVVAALHSLAHGAPPAIPAIQGNSSSSSSSSFQKYSSQQPQQQQQHPPAPPPAAAVVSSSFSSFQPHPSAAAVAPTVPLPTSLPVPPPSQRISTLTPSTTVATIPAPVPPQLSSPQQSTEGGAGGFSSGQKVKKKRKYSSELLNSSSMASEFLMEVRPKKSSAQSSPSGPMRAFNDSPANITATKLSSSSSSKPNPAAQKNSSSSSSSSSTAVAAAAASIRQTSTVSPLPSSQQQLLMDPPSSSDFFSPEDHPHHQLLHDPIPPNSHLMYDEFSLDITNISKILSPEKEDGDSNHFTSPAASSSLSDPLLSHHPTAATPNGLFASVMKNISK